MTGYTKLFAEIVGSSVWGEDDQTRIVWITLLALKNKDHIVRLALTGLSRLANVPLDATQRAVDKFLSPDPYSRSREHEGRRIKAVDGGWLILNGEKYREKLNLDERREYLRQAQRRYRGKQKKLNKAVSARERLADRQYQSSTEEQ